MPTDMPTIFEIFLRRNTYITEEDTGSLAIEGDVE